MQQTVCSVLTVSLHRSRK